MEKEAYRRVKKGSLSPAEIQKLGLTLKAVKKISRKFKLFLA